MACVQRCSFAASTMLHDDAVADDGEAKVDIHRQRYPHAVVWGPLGPLTCCCPCVGHMGIADSQGRIHDFAGTYSIGIDDFMVGTVWRYAVVTPTMDRNWDRAISKADEVYSTKHHNICCQNCHHHTALALEAAGFPQWGCDGLISTWLFCCLHGRCTWCEY
mmetsp:Transcript_25469/g.77365  ORF Transcript_25469/g.77365 Transcript_25469/m.77365 type:complete len:162 (-) Transcript_25469:435-920(-)|eukprot:scaffold65452_cov44-Tisochrysis_lutea.AAC.2